MVQVACAYNTSQTKIITPTQNSKMEHSTTGSWYNPPNLQKLPTGTFYNFQTCKNSQLVLFTTFTFHETTPDVIWLRLLHPCSRHCVGAIYNLKNKLETHVTCDVGSPHATCTRQYFVYFGVFNTCRDYAQSAKQARFLLDYRVQLHLCWCSSDSTRKNDTIMQTYMPYIGRGTLRAACSHTAAPHCYEFAIEWCSRELLGCHVALYLAVRVLPVGDRIVP